MFPIVAVSAPEIESEPTAEDGFADILFYRKEKDGAEWTEAVWRGPSSLPVKVTGDFLVSLVPRGEPVEEGLKRFPWPMRFVGDYDQSRDLYLIGRVV